jgi:hypothetical protein
MEAVLFKAEVYVAQEKVEWRCHQSYGDTAEQHAVRTVVQEEVEHVAGCAEGHIAEVDFTL